jgi:hypothetical protein
MRVTIYQPQYFPRLHYFNRVIDADSYVILDSAQYIKVMIHLDTGRREKHKSYQSDTPIKLPHGIQFLTVPVKRTVDASGFLPINQTRIEYTHDWVSKHLRTLHMAYMKAAFYKKIFPQIEELLNVKYKNLADLNIKTTLWGLSNTLGLNIPTNKLTIDLVNKRLKKGKDIRLKKILRDSEAADSKFANTNKANKWIVSICKSIGATTLFHGETSKAGYIDLEYFKKSGIDSAIQSWKCQEYTQQFNYRVNFVPNLSILDLLFNVNQKAAHDILVSV